MERTLLIYSLVTVVYILQSVTMCKFYLPCHKHGRVQHELDFGFGHLTLTLISPSPTHHL
jgi:hypothetical protein